LGLLWRSNLIDFSKEKRIETLFDVKNTGAKESEKENSLLSPPSTILNINSYNKK
jgi:hypothetical protein